MFSSVLSAVVLGLEVCPIRVEADVSDGLPCFAMVGFVSSQVKEAQDRVRTALRNIQIALPPKKITVNLAPVDIRKEGAGFDLPVAGAVLASMGKIPVEMIDQVLMIGELGLNGEIHPVSGILPIVMKAKEMGCRACIIPGENLREGRLVKGIPVYGVDTLKEVIELLGTVREFELEEQENSPIGENKNYDVDFADIKGQEVLKRAAVIATGGMHNLLLIGQPGSGKTMVARRIPTIMPEMTEEESMEITRIYSVAGLLTPESPVIRTRPFRSPHHTTSSAALAGGGRIPKPGEVTLAHRGVLFLDEMPEFSRSALEILRQPMEDQKIHLSRAMGTYTFPANFMLVAAMNPCPCGYYPNMNRCNCTASEIHHYLHKISQPLLDRLDLCVEAPAVTWEDMQGRRGGTTSAQMRELVSRVHQIQKERYAGTALRFNSDLTAGTLEKYCVTDREAQQFLQDIFRQMHFSVRGYHRILKVSRTIADLAESETIHKEHISEALMFRMVDKKYWGG